MGAEPSVALATPQFASTRSKRYTPHKRASLDFSSNLPGTVAMRISLKWILAGVAYVAVAAAAVVQSGPFLGACLWVGTAFPVLYALLAVAYFRGRGQAIAAGFALFAIGSIIGILGFPASSIIADLLRPAMPATVVSEEELARASRRVERLVWEAQISANAASSEYQTRTQQQLRAAERRLRGLSSLESLVGTVEAVCVMAAGLIGCFVGAHVWKVAERSRRSAAANDARGRTHRTTQRGPENAA